MHSQEYLPRKMLSAPQAAAYCGSCVSTLAKLRFYGGGPLFVKLGRRVVYDRTDLDNWLVARKRKTVSDVLEQQHRDAVSASPDTPAADSDLAAMQVPLDSNPLCRAWRLASDDERAEFEGIIADDFRHYHTRGE